MTGESRFVEAASANGRLQDTVRGGEVNEARARNAFWKEQGSSWPVPPTVMHGDHERLLAGMSVNHPH